MTIASNYPRTGQVGQSLRIPLRLTQGRATVVTTWLADGATATAAAPTGIEFSSLDVFVVPQRTGTWRLYAAAEDACGNRNQTGVVRTVTVQ